MIKLADECQKHPQKNLKASRNTHNSYIAREGTLCTLKIHKPASKHNNLYIHTYIHIIIHLQPPPYFTFHGTWMVKESVVRTAISENMLCSNTLHNYTTTVIISPCTLIMKTKLTYLYI